MRKLVLAAALAAAALTPACAPSVDKPKLVILGFDGLDASLTREWMREGKLPNLSKLAARGGFHQLETTPSPDSATAWASFATGLNAGKHDVFAHSETVSRRPPRFLFDYIPLGRERLTTTRNGTSFWVTAGETGVRSSIIAVPVTFPPEAVPNGELLANAPDIRHTPGTFQYFATNVDPAHLDDVEGGIITPLVFDKDIARATVTGPVHPINGTDVTVPLSITWNREVRSANIELGGTSVHLKEREWSRWLELDFPVNAMWRVRGMTQLLLLAAGTAKDFRLFLSPINWHPGDSPSPISSPASFAGDLVERLGLYRTLSAGGSAAALNAEVIDEAAFMDELDRAFQDRAETILNRADMGAWDLLVGVNDATDHVQHMMWRLVDQQHPRHDSELARRYSTSIEQIYQQVDEFVGDVVSRLPDDAVVLVVSDHGFEPARSTVDLTAWLVAQGYADRATVKGTGIYINADAPNRDGIADALTIALGAFRDPRNGETVVRNVYPRAKTYSGPFVAHAPDLQVGLARGYVASADSQSTSGGAVIIANATKWSGQHASADYALTPGVLISNVALTNASPTILDIAPTVLKHFGVRVPTDLDGKPLF